MEFSTQATELGLKKKFWQVILSAVSITFLLENIISVIVLELAVREVVRFIFNLTYFYLLTQWSRVVLEKRTGSQLVKKFPLFCGTRRFITVLTSARQLSYL